MVLKMSRSTTKPIKWHVRPAKDRPGHSPNLIRYFAVRVKKPWVLSYPLSAQRRLWSDWADAQADLSLRWVHMPFLWFCRALTQIIVNTAHLKRLPLFGVDNGEEESKINKWKRRGLAFWCQKRKWKSYLWPNYGFINESFYPPPPTPHIWSRFFSWHPFPPPPQHTH